MSILKRAAKRTSDEEKRRVFNHERLKEEVAHALSLALESQGLTRSDLASRLDCSRSYVTKILDGFPNFTLAKLADITLALGYFAHFKLGRTRIVHDSEAEGSVSETSIEHITTRRLAGVRFVQHAASTYSYGDTVPTGGAG